MQKKQFPELGLSSDMLKAIDRLGFEVASPIQSQAIPHLLAGKDVVGQSQTGSGKTLAYAIPAVERVDAELRCPQVLILCPTRELAIQVAEEVAKLIVFKPGIRELPIYGGQSYERQFRGLKAGAQIIIGTPGRILDHLDQGSLKLDQVRTVVLDEADRMLDMGFLEDIKTVISQLPEKRQMALFSATLPQPILKLVERFTHDAVRVRIESQALAVPAIEQVYYEVERRSKLEVLCRLIDIHDVKLGIIFCATKRMVDELVDHLAVRGYLADKLHGDLSQKMRERVVEKFRKRSVEFLVATDVAARGLDVEDVEVVFNYDLPQDGEDYVHRIGRTGRAGRGGKAVTFVAGREVYELQDIARFTKGRIRRERVPSLEEVEERRANLFFEALRETLEEGKYPRRDSLVERLLDQGYSSTDIASALIHLLNPENPDNRQKISEETESHFDKQGKRGSKEHTRKFPNISHEKGMTRLSLNVGRAHRVRPGDIVGMILGSASLDRTDIGAIQLFPKSAFVDIATNQVPLVLKKMKSARFKGHKLDLREERDPKTDAY